MRYLLLYGTTDGQTRKIARFIGDKFKELRQDIVIRDCSKTGLRPDFRKYNGVILAGPIYNHMHPEALLEIASTFRDGLADQPTWLVSVSLASAFKNGQEAAGRYVQGFVEQSGLAPVATSKVAGSLKFTEYDRYMHDLLENITLTEDEHLTEDREFTDWHQLQKDVHSFARLVIHF